MNSPFRPPLTALLLLFLIACKGPAELSVRVSGDSAGKECAQIAVGLTSYNLHYPLLGDMTGWSRGIPSVSDVKAEIYLYAAETSKLERVVAIAAPARWRDDASRFSVTPRLMPGDSLVFMLHGCPKEEPNCQEYKYYRLEKNGSYAEISAWPEVSAEESADIKDCTSYQTYDNGSYEKSFISVGPTGGPWKPVLQFDGKQLSMVGE
ncbi:MAG: hypothetical protein PHC51_03695 [bacterium]|nr:hypothetical protein [bacterium]